MNYISFFTATILEWKHLLLNDVYKDIVISSMKYLVNDGRVNIFAFVIMPNHIHLVWKVADNRKPEDVQRDFLKYTAQKISLNCQMKNLKILSNFMLAQKTGNTRYGKEIL